ncbi:uncharacterized protein YbjT (DUF2867 family) [Pseudonocardia hierapolitana]|uniref:Uncharacterized protein YbjT (DUF2867 family) n=1 Tax=Pseudonocardia hierapolitana TaxID=1128676 RepID=A0A561SNU6_9PSEU|nr:NAD(P)H-binding protein [Pseudonocardia hierapolitana]TWF76516.1 uncharacterized protein YbjT (DUF2867 family) [Pseudonocardia hierapolitana]
MGSTVLVTGATGKTGRRLIPLLLDHGVTVRAASRTPVPERLGVEPVRFDWLDETTHQAVLDGVDAVYAISDPSNWSNQSFEAFLERATGGSRRVVLLSSFGVDRAPANDPMRRVELLVERSGTVLRPTMFMQDFSEDHWSNQVTSIRERGEITLPNVRARVSYVSTADIAAIAAAALTEDGHQGKGYTITGPEALTSAQVAEHISAAAGRPVHPVEVDREGIRAGLLAYGYPAGSVEYVSPGYAAGFVAMDVVNDTVTKVTGRPATTFAEFAKDVADAWR